MGKKRKASGASAQPKGPRQYDPKDSRLGPVTTFEDLADSEEEYWKNQDEILFSDEPNSKKQKRLEEEEKLLEDSDEEVFGYDEDDSDDEDQAVALKSRKELKTHDEESESEHDGDDQEEDQGWWGVSKKEYYNADNPETEADALEEEEEARRLQKKKLSKMTEEDFIFDENEWLAPEDEKKDQSEVVTEFLKDVEIPEDMSQEERSKLLQARYPELDYLADELLELQPLLITLQKEAQGQTSKSLAVVKYRILGCYVATLALYFATLTSPARDSDGSAKALDPAELRDHEVMGTLLECREAWQEVKDRNAFKSTEAAASLLSPPEEDSVSAEDVEVSSLEPEVKPKKFSAEQKANSTKAARAAADIEDSLADLSALSTTAKKSKKKTRQETAPDDHSDFGEEETLDAKAAADKAARKKSLRFYTSQIAQKSNRRAGAGRDAGGDMDLPYRERLRDRQARLNAQAEKRGQKNSKHGAELGADSDDEDKQVANAVRDNGDDEYYDMVAAKSKAKKDDKAARSAALASANAVDRVVEKEEIGEDGKRKITYAIEKNKGLAPKRKKDVRNPRVKKRKAFEAKKKKLGSMKAVYKGGAGAGGYQGELTGIKSTLVKSRKL